MGFLDKIIEGASDVVSDTIQDLVNGDVVGAVVEIGTAGMLGMTEVGDVVQEQIEIGIEAGIDYVQGEDVSLEYDPEVVSDLGDAALEDAGDVIEIISGF
jgi:hypothetical protein